MNIKKLRTRQEFHNYTNPKGKDYIIGLDIGYSATKVFYETGYFCIPSYARRLTNGMVNITNDKDILYREEGSDDLYMVGYTAQEMVDAMNTNDSDSELFSRKRYGDKRFGIICNVALGLAIIHKNDNRNIVIQTGLPSSYLEEDTKEIKKALTKDVKFEIKIGGGEWKKIHLQTDGKNIDVMHQPKGSLYSVITKPDGKYIENANAILNDNVLVLDAGFGTFDFYGISNREVKCKESTDELGMRQVIAKAAGKILKETGMDIRINAMQKYIAKGEFDYLNEEEMTSEFKPIAPYLEEANKEIINEAKQKIKSVTNSLRGYRYIIVAGGTGEAWVNEIKEWLGNMKTITIIESNRNDNLPFIYSNVRGYYLYRYALNKR